MEAFTQFPAIGQASLADLEKFGREHRTLLQNAALVTLAAATGVIAGGLLVKGMLVKGGALPLLLQNGATVVSHAPTSAVALQNGAHLGMSTSSGAATLSTKLSALLNTISHHAVPLTAGAVGGGAVGVGVTQGQVRSVKQRLIDQILQTEAVQAEVVRLQTALTAVENTLEALQAKVVLPSAPIAPVPDRLEEIRGIGTTFARRLNAAGIYTFADLAAQPPDTLRTLIGQTRVSPLVDPQQWITEAAQRAAGNPAMTGRVAQAVPHAGSMLDQTMVDLVLDQLEAIPGITSPIAARLNQVGILTYTDLAAQQPARLRTVLQGQAAVSEAAIQNWISEANRLHLALGQTKRQRL